MTAIVRALSRLARSGALLAVAVASGAITTSAQSSRVAGRLVADTLHAVSLEHNRYGDSPNRSLLVYLPPGYDTSAATRYPVVYLLHGFGTTERSWVSGYRGFNIGTAMDSLIGVGAIHAMIIVMPNARTRLGGSFYTNSESAGNWDDFVTRELVAYIDRKYRTLARADSRGLAGHSMGGYGALAIGMRHGGDVYGAVYAMSACCTRFSPDLTADTEEIWRTLLGVGSMAEAQGLSFYPQVYLAMSAAFSPDANRAPLYVDFPFELRDGRWYPVEDVQDEWAQHAPYNMIPRSIGRLRRLRGFAFDVGTHDQLVAPSELAAVDSALTIFGIVHHFETYDGDHANRIGDRMTTKVLPFFSRVLDFMPLRP